MAKTRQQKKNLHSRKTFQIWKNVFDKYMSMFIMLFTDKTTYDNISSDICLVAFVFYQFYADLVFLLICKKS